MLKRIQKQLKKKNGFTLVELIVVIAVLGVLSAVAVPRLGGYMEGASKAADEVTAANIAKAVEMYNAMNNEDSDNVPTPYELIDAELLGENDFTPQYNNSTNLGYYVDVDNYNAEVHYASTAVVTSSNNSAWGTKKGSSQIYPR